MKTRLKTVLCTLLLILYFITVIPLYPFLLIAPYKSRRLVTQIIKFFSRMILIILRVKVKRTGDISPPEGNLIVCNHVSYIDIFIVASTFPSCFVTSYEMKETTGLGLICTLGGCLFVERRSRKNIGSEVKELSQGLRKKLNVMFYPEATSTNGTQVIEFKRSLFHAAVEAECDTLPLCINYKTLNGENITKENKDNVFWYGDKVSFGQHFSKFCRNGSIEVEITILPKITLSEVGHDSKVLRDRAHFVISESYKNIN